MPAINTVIIYVDVFKSHRKMSKEQDCPIPHVSFQDSLEFTVSAHSSPDQRDTDQGGVCFCP